MDTLVNGFLARYSKSTARAYGEDLGLYRKYCEDHGIDPLRVTRPDVDRFARWQESRGNKPSSVARRMSAVRQFYKVIYLDGQIPEDPAKDVNVPRVHRDRSGQVHLSIEQMRSIIEASKDEGQDAHTLVVLMLSLGIRVSEACAVDVEDFSGGVLRTRSKGDKDRAVPAPGPVEMIVKASGRPSGPAVVRKDGRRMDRRTAQRIVKRVSERAGIDENVTPHDLRAAYITYALDQGLSIYEVQDMAGHASPTTTEIYDRARRRRASGGNDMVTNSLGL